MNHRSVAASGPIDGYVSEMVQDWR